MLANKFFITILTLLIFNLPGLTTNTIEGYGIQYNGNEAFIKAENKFSLSNISAAHSDFRQLINSANNTDFFLLSRAITLAEYGFFDLTDSIFSKIDDYEISKNYVSEIKQFYYPAKRLNEEQIILLAEAYSNIVYNNYAQEAVLEIVNHNLLQINNDYTAYILALAYYETKDFIQAKNYISLAITQNPTNINYKILKTKILLDLNESKEALKLLEELKKEPLHIEELKTKILALEQFVAYKAQKNPKFKNLHLAHYYLLQGKIPAAQRVLLSNLSNNKKINGDIYALLANTYLKTDMQKAVENARKSLKYKCEKSSNYYILGLEKLNDNATKSALRLLNKIKSPVQEARRAKCLIAQVYSNANKAKQAEKLWENIAKKYPESYEAYYYIAKYDSENAEQYLKKSLSYNINFKPSYYALCQVYLERENFNLAKEFLNNVKDIDENDFRYYYYLSQVEFASGNDALAKDYENKCSTLEPNFRDIINKENTIEK